MVGRCSLSACAESESIPPAYQTISPIEKEEKEKLVFERALSAIGMVRHMMDFMLLQKAYFTGKKIFIW